LGRFCSRVMGFLRKTLIFVSAKTIINIKTE